MQYIEIKPQFEKILLAIICSIHNWHITKILEIFRRQTVWTKYINSVIFFIAYVAFYFI